MRRRARLASVLPPSDREWPEPCWLRAGTGAHLAVITDAVRLILDLPFILRVVFSQERDKRAEVAVIILGASRKCASRRGWIRLAAFFILCLSMPRLAYARQAELVTPITLFDPEKGEGVRIAPAFVLHLQTEARMVHDSNIYDLAKKRDDQIAVLEPRFLIESDFPRHAFDLRGRAEIRRHLNIRDEDSEQFELEARGKLELGGHVDVEPTLEYGKGIEQRGTAGDQFATDEPVSFQRMRAALQIARMVSKLGLSARGSIVKRDYDDAELNGIPIDLALRNTTTIHGRLRAELRLNERTNAFAELHGNKVKYEREFAIPRDSKGFSVLGGVRFHVTSLINIEAAAGYIHHKFDNPAFKSLNSFDYRVAANWTPMPSWSFSATAQRTIEPGPRIDVPAIVCSDFRLEAQHAVGDRLLLGAEAVYLKEDYRGLPRTDHRYLANFTAHYRVTQKASLILRAGYRKQEGGKEGRSYEGAAVSLGIRITV